MDTMVVPVPCTPLLPLKLETRTSPGASGPPGRKPTGTKATPYGLPSPLDGTVDTIRSGLVGSWPRMDSAIAHVGTRRVGSARKAAIRIGRFIVPPLLEELGPESAPACKSLVKKAPIYCNSVKPYRVSPAP